MVTQQQLVLTPSVDWLGTIPEYSVYWALVRLGYIPDVDFIYQSSQLGGRLDKGGAVIDFEIFEPHIALNIQSFYWHYGRPNAIASDLLQRQALEGMGIRVVYIDEDDAIRAPLYYTQQALLGNDFSTMGRV